MPPRLDGPRLAPASGRAPEQLIVFLHGYGADGNDLIGLGRQWRALLPNAQFVAPNAPERCAMSPMGYQWFPLAMRDPAERWQGVQQAAPALNAFLDSELERHGLGDKDLGLVGFSQGTMMALHVGLRRERTPAAIVGYSGALAGAENLAEDIQAKPPILLVHGDQDPVIPIEALHHAREHLAATGLTVEWHVAQGVPHGIDPMGLSLGGDFLARAFASALAG